MPSNANTVSWFPYLIVRLSQNLEKISIETSVKTGGIVICFPDPFDPEPSETTQFEINKID